MCVLQVPPNLTTYGSGFHPPKRCRHFGSTWNRYMTIKVGDCTPTACRAHLTRPQKALSSLRRTLVTFSQTPYRSRPDSNIKLMTPSLMGKSCDASGKYWQYCCDGDTVTPQSNFRNKWLRITVIKFYIFDLQISQLVWLPGNGLSLCTHTDTPSYSHDMCSANKITSQNQNFIHHQYMKKNLKRTQP